MPSGVQQQQQLLCCPLLTLGKRLRAGMLVWLFYVTVWSLAMPLGEKYLAVLELWDHEWLRQGKRKMLWLCTSKVSSIILKDRSRGSMCHLPSQRLNHEGPSLSSTNPLQLFLMYTSSAILNLCLFNTLGCVLWRKPLANSSFWSPYEVLQEIHTDLIFLSMISLLAELNIISWEVPVLSFSPGASTCPVN